MRGVVVGEHVEQPRLHALGRRLAREEEAVGVGPPHDAEGQTVKGVLGYGGGAVRLCHHESDARERAVLARKGDPLNGLVGGLVGEFGGHVSGDGDEAGRNGAPCQILRQDQL